MPIIRVNQREIYSEIGKYSCVVPSYWRKQLATGRLEVLFDLLRGRLHEYVLLLLLLLLLLHIIYSYIFSVV